MLTIQEQAEISFKAVGLITDIFSGLPAKFLYNGVNQSVRIIWGMLLVRGGFRMACASLVCHIRFCRSASQTLRPSLPHKGRISIL